MKNFVIEQRVNPFDEWNKLITEFMGILPFSQSGQYEAKDIILALDMTMNPCVHFNSPFDVLYIDDMKFQKSWDWLMPVWVKLNEICSDKGLQFYKKFRELPCSRKAFEMGYGMGDIKIAYEETVECIKWYNENDHD